MFEDRNTRRVQDYFGLLAVGLRAEGWMFTVLILWSRLPNRKHSCIQH